MVIAVSLIYHCVKELEACLPPTHFPFKLHWLKHHARTYIEVFRTLGGHAEEGIESLHCLFQTWNVPAVFGDYTALMVCSISMASNSNASFLYFGRELFGVHDLIENFRKLLALNLFAYNICQKRSVSQHYCTRNTFLTKN